MMMMMMIRSTRRQQTSANAEPRKHCSNYLRSWTQNSYNFPHPAMLTIIRL